MQESGGLSIELDVADGLVCAARIRSRRPTALARLFEGRAAREAPDLSRRLFTLCARAHAAAAAAALRAARGEVAGPEALRREALGVLSERLFETLRTWTLAFPAEESRRDAEALRALHVAAQSLGPRGESLPAYQAAAAALGLVPGDPPAGTALARALREASLEAGIALTPPDPLTARDDAAVAHALAADPGFAAAPSLPGRHPETGAFARVWPDIPEGCGALAARAQSRIEDARRTLAALAGLISRKCVDAQSVIAEGAMGEGGGYGAVECARGRLYHVVRLSGDGRIAAYGVVAPTEWNFHPRGPLAQMLVGARLGKTRTARVAERLAFLVDPCAAFEIALREAA